MAVLVPAVGTVSYNGVTFGAKTHLGVEITPVEDEAQRTSVYLSIVVTIDTFITGDEAIAASATSQGTPYIDSKLEQIRKLCFAPGGALIVDDQGFGSIRVNVAGESVKDVDYGPKIRKCSITPVGSARAANLKLIIEAKIPQCDDARYQQTPMAMNYEAHWHIRDGITSRTVTGYIEIPMTRTTQTNRTPPDDADKYRERLQNSVPPGFKRTFQDFRDSKNKRRLDFTFVDEELDSDNPPPDEAIEIKDRHRVRSSLKEGFTSWTSSFSASIRVKKGADRQAQWTAFYTFIKDRYEQIVNGQLPDGVAGLVSVIPLDYEFVEEIHDRLIEFAISVRVITSLQTILKASGIWRPYPAAAGDWGTWATSLDNDAWSLRGYANMASLPTDDVIVDLCGGEAKLQPRQPPFPSPEPQDAPDLLGIPKPSPGQSWLKYESYLVPHRTDSMIRHKLLQKLGPTKIPGPLEWLDPNTTEGMRVGINEGKDDVFQQFSTPTYTVALVGSAARAGYKIPLPNVLKIGGVTPTLLGGGAAQRVIANAGEYPVYGASWARYYALPNCPAGELDFPPDHQQHIDPTLTGVFS